MSDKPQSDEQSRHRIVHDIERNIFVDAGAGTGKTTALVGRIVHLVSSGTVGITQIAAITFTEAAAAELRERIRRSLEETSEASDNPGVRQRCAQALDDLDQAAISTLHAFARRILTEFALAAGLPPGFDVLIEPGATVQFHERWREFLDTKMADPELEAAFTTAFGLGFTTGDLERFAHDLRPHADRLTLPRSQNSTVRPIDVAPIVAALEKATSFSQYCSEPTDKLLAHLHALKLWTKELRTTTDNFSLLLTLAELPKLTSNRGQAQHWSGMKAEVVNALAEANTVREATITGLRVPAMEALVNAITRFSRGAIDLRIQAGNVEFQDLLVLARDLLRRDSHVRAALHDRYRVLMLDEFQDTDPLQIEIATLIATDDPEPGTRNFAELSVPAGRLFVVGDPKQSIYRFRRANIALYHRVRESFGADVEQLNHNFRSRPEILAFVNAVFAELFSVSDDAASLQTTYAPLESHRPSNNGPAVHVIGDASDADGGVTAVRALEAHEISATIAAIRSDAWQVGDERHMKSNPGATRPARYADIAILIPTRTSLDALLGALDDAGIPARVESTSPAYRSEEVRTLLVLLEAIDDPANGIAVVGALRSPTFGCSDADLVAWHTAGRSFNPLALASTDDVAISSPVFDALTRIAALHEQRTWLSLATLVETVIRECRLFEVEFASFDRRARDAWRRFRLIADLARSFETSTPTRLRGFVQFVRRQIEEDAKITEHIVAESDDDAVRILTVHHAKGLEFPIVLLCGLNARAQNQPPRVLFDDHSNADGHTVEIRIGTRDAVFETPRYAALKDLDDAAGRYEATRLLYVAATRARDHLVVSLHRGSGKQDQTCAAAQIARALESSPDAQAVCYSLAVGTEDGPRPTVPPGVPAPGMAPVSDRQRWSDERRQLVERLRTFPQITATSLAQLMDPSLRGRDATGLTAAPGASGGEATEGDSAEGDSLDSATTPVRRRGRAGTAIGRAVHAVLQTVDLAGASDLGETCRARALEENVAEHEDDIRRLVTGALNAPIVAEALTHRFWREVPVAATISGVLIDGYIDLLFEDSDGLVIVDYKTDAFAEDGDLDHLVERYRAQVAAYAVALEAAVARPVSRICLLFTHRLGAELREIADPSIAKQEVRFWLASFTMSE